MDAYSTSVTSPSRRGTSRIYQDLTSCRYHHVLGLDSHQVKRTMNDMDTDHENIQTAPKARIGIVGAGLSGLRCADILLQNGFEVTILEGRDRVGGRVHQHRLPNGRLVDEGPNWIHGTNDNPILDIAKKTNTATGSWDTRSFVFNESGELFSSADGEHYSTVMWDIIKDAFEYSGEHSASIDPQESLLDFFNRRILERIPETKENWERQREIVMQMADLWGAFVGSPIERQSLKFFWLEECIEGENLFCAGTYAKILDEIAKPALENASILLEKTVAFINTKGTADEKVAIITATGEHFSFDEVVVTAPLGWLQQNLGAFEPPLPDRLVKAVGSIGYGCLEKVYISFPKAFWLDTSEDGRTIRGFCQWLSPNYALDSNPKRWTHEVVELGSLAPSVAHPTLLFYIYGEESQVLTETVSKLPNKEAKDKFLYDFFKPYYSLMPHFEQDSAECQPTGCFATDWLHDDLAGNGSYGNFQVGLQEGDKDIQAMREGAPERGLWLAGEHTAPFVALGTATGAYWSGESVGRRMAEAYGLRHGEVVGTITEDVKLA